MSPETAEQSSRAAGQRRGRMTDCVDGVETLGGSSQPLRMEQLNITEKLDRTLKNNAGIIMII